ncbi:hypothetical protein LPJ66_001598 [Kickxella alabastrina]|uniref:Uncharacterized protein n=1 Tax=Kickxella alabastrina TaxID=61397 RepID=A0ACC1IT36_9FUNG|nr:hypothetical protein LPJ66_001598 [Kickxella alabastrina]
MHTVSQLAAAVFVIFVVAFAGAQQPQHQPGQQPSKAAPPPFTLTMETTYRPEYTDTDVELFSPLPMTPDLGIIAKSLAAQPSVVNAMQKARIGWDSSPNTRVEL